MNLLGGSIRGTKPFCKFDYSLSIGQERLTFMQIIINSLYPTHTDFSNLKKTTQQLQAATSVVKARNQPIPHPDIRVTIAWHLTNVLCLSKANILQSPRSGSSGDNLSPSLPPAAVRHKAAAFQIHPAHPARKGVAGFPKNEIAKNDG